MQCSTLQCISVHWIKIQHKAPEKKLVSIQVTAAVEHSEVLCSAVQPIVALHREETSAA